MIIAGTHGKRILNVTSLALTTADQLGVVGTSYSIDFSGATANRIFELPAGYRGAVMEVYIDVPDDTYTLTIRGDTGVSIDGGTAAADWATISTIGGQRFLFEWFAENDVRCIERPKRMFKVEGDGVGTYAISTDAAWDKITAFDTVVDDIYGLWDTTNERFSLPVGYYHIGGLIAMQTAISDGGSLRLGLEKNATAVNDRFGSFHQSGTATEIQWGWNGVLYVDTASDYFELNLRKEDDSDTSRSLYTTSGLLYMTVIEA